MDWRYRASNLESYTAISGLITTNSGFRSPLAAARSESAASLMLNKRSVPIFDVAAAGIFQIQPLL